MKRSAAMEPRIIKTEEQHRAYLDEVERLVTEDPIPGTADGDRLELLAKLVEDYEKERFKFNRPDPVDAIVFRMEERGLKQKDLAPLLGGKNRVSEVLSRKRPLTLAMVRALSESLRIPAELLIREPEAPEYKVAEVHSRRRTITYGATPQTNKNNLQFWVSRVREIANTSRTERGAWRPESLDEEFLSYVARLSWSEKGPRQVRDFLAEKGVTLVLLPALPHTKLDGAAMLDQQGAPIVGLTVRHDRLDNFWFTLLHELVHVWKHLPDKDTAITDESIEDGRDDDSKEAEANRIARDIFIPRAVWKRSEAFLHPSVATIYALADKLHISPAIVAGRLRHEKTGHISHRAFGKLVGNKQVRQLFPEIKWISESATIAAADAGGAARDLIKRNAGLFKRLA